MSSTKHASRIALLHRHTFSLQLRSKNYQKVYIRKFFLLKQLSGSFRFAGVSTPYETFGKFMLNSVMPWVGSESFFRKLECVPVANNFPK